MTRAFCILGMHRSGTSLVAQLLARLGVDFGPREELLAANVDNPKGYWEIERIVHANDWVLQDLGRRWDTAFPLPRDWHASPELHRHRAHVRRILDELFDGSTTFGWKDPRCCLTLPLWRAALAESDTPMHSVLVLRNPLDVARSLARRNGFPVANGLGLWYHYTLQSLVDSAETARIVVRYPDLLDRPLREASRIAETLGLDTSTVEAAVEETIDPALCHSRSDAAELADEAPELVTGFYDYFDSVARGEVSWADLDRDAEDRLQSLHRFAAVLRHDREREVRESARIEHLESRVRNLRARMERTETLEQELEAIHTSSWWRWADRYWKARQRFLSVTRRILGGARRTSRRLTPGPDPFARVSSPWDTPTILEACSDPCFCNLCWWSGATFEGRPHSESALCPECGSIARDRFLFFCFISRTPPGRHRVLETSPRLGEAYRRAMRRWFDYRASDFDQRAHRADLQLDLQDIHLESASVDVLLTPHVLEHVPDTGKALDGIHRLLAPGGRMYLQVPVLQGRTAKPEEPEFHGDDTPVEWRFGPDLTHRLAEHGFETRLLSTEELYHRVADDEATWDGPTSPEFDVPDLLAGLGTVDLSPVADDDVCRQLGFVPSYMFLTWEALNNEIPASKIV